MIAEQLAQARKLGEVGGTDMMIDRWKHLFPDAPVPTVKPQQTDRDCPHCNYSGTVHCGDVAAQIQANGGEHGNCSNAHAYGLRAAPQPQQGGTARGFIEWCKAQPEDKEPVGIDEALAEYEAICAAPQTQAVNVTAVGEIKRDAEGTPDVSWLIEGGAYELPEGVVLLVADTPVTDDFGRGEVYIKPVIASAAQKAPT